jgi:Lectin C-type domain
MLRIAVATILLLVAYEGLATAQTYPKRVKPCKKMRGNACPQKESARTTISAASAASLIRAAVSGSVRGRPADAVLQSQCLDMNGTPLTVHVHSGHIYSYVSTMKFESWHDANLAASTLSCCQAKGRLLVVNGASEREFVKSSVVPKSSTGWVGLVDEANDGVWKAGQASALVAVASSNEIARPFVEEGNGGDNNSVDCVSDSNYDDKDYMYGVRCRDSWQLPIIVEFDCSEGR